MDAVGFQCSRANTTTDSDPVLGDHLIPDCTDDGRDLPTPANLPISFLMQLNQEELGSMAGLSRETVSRLLTRFRREGLVDQSDDRMTLNNPGRLEARYR